MRVSISKHIMTTCQPFNGCTTREQINYPPYTCLTIMSSILFSIITIVLGGYRNTYIIFSLGNYITLRLLNYTSYNQIIITEPIS